MLRTLLVLLAVSFSCADLRADVIETQDGTRYEGVVVEFASDIVRLNTGYGKLTFRRKTNFKSGEVKDYKWPKGVEVEEGPKPKTAALFVEWCKKNPPAKKPGDDNNQKADEPKEDEGANSDGSSWTTIKKERYEDEEANLDAAWKAVTAYETLRDDPEKSVKEKEKAFTALKKLDGKWCFVSLAVDRVDQDGNELTVEFLQTRKAETKDVWTELSGYRAHDARTGAAMEPLFSNFFTLRAKKGTLASRVDELNEVGAVEKGLRDSREFFVDWDEAADWKRGTGVVFAIRLSVKDSNDINWQVFPTRLRVIKPPVIVGDDD